MLIKTKWVCEGIIDVYTATLIALVLTGFFKALSINPAAIILLLQLQSLYYLARIATKKSWIVKEGVYSIGSLIAGIHLNDLWTTVIASTAISIVILRKFRKFLQLPYIASELYLIDHKLKSYSSQ